VGSDALTFPVLRHPREGGDLRKLMAGINRWACTDPGLRRDDGVEMEMMTWTIEGVVCPARGLPSGRAGMTKWAWR
jgi:hypothetical protein